MICRPHLGPGLWRSVGSGKSAHFFRPATRAAETPFWRKPQNGSKMFRKFKSQPMARARVSPGAGRAGVGARGGRGCAAPAARGRVGASRSRVGRRELRGASAGRETGGARRRAESSTKQNTFEQYLPQYAHRTRCAEENANPFMCVHSAVRPCAETTQPHTPTRERNGRGIATTF